MAMLLFLMAIPVYKTKVISVNSLAIGANHPAEIPFIQKFTAMA
jgi:hypothetical protein